MSAEKKEKIISRKIPKIDDGTLENMTMKRY